MRLPEGLRHRIVYVCSNVIGNGRRRPVYFAAAAIEAPQPVVDARQPQDRQRQGRDEQQQPENDQADCARERRQYQPEARPGECEEKSEDDRNGGERRPQPLPQQAAARPPQCTREQTPRRLLVVWLLVQLAQKPAPPLWPRRISTTGQRNMRRTAGPRGY